MFKDNATLPKISFILVLMASEILKLQRNRNTSSKVMVLSPFLRIRMSLYQRRYVLASGRERSFAVRDRGMWLSSCAINVSVLFENVIGSFLESPVSSAIV
ncbi:hypothetical protein OGAPHI_004411 [Ogataea philodendri]|uniref:Uncharacterized protein n=1 Tax=Ogataea philodendri TaxID=1378263 RepID=A0A9P8P7G9_9ASCO|nr:uncharacterized protein OGAPHI_004411 [Ogataea philodendri]KAH3666222.1 hypothetical protein OGAPHI_004411 [Ogataea philodendri]